METKVKGNGTAVNNDKSKASAFVNNNPVNKDNTKPAEAGKEKEAVNGATVEQPGKPGEPITTEPKAEVKTEPAKAEAKAEPAKPVMNLDNTVKVVLALNRKIQYRNNLQSIVANLDAFEVKQEEDAEETGSNSYQGCELTIKDDKGRSFTTKNPGLIFHCAQYVNHLCVQKVTEIEAEIIIPA
jgi:hypothetical protein